MIALLSIKPEFALRIFAGTKKFEYRRLIFKQNVTKVIVYASAPISKIIGEFEVRSVLRDAPKVLWDQTKHQSGISEKKFFAYFSDRNEGYAICIGEATEYNVPVSLQEEFGLQPPQSFIYLSCPVKTKVNDLKLDI